MSEEEFSFEDFGKGLMIRKFSAVIPCNSVYMIDIGCERAGYGLCEFLSIFAVLEFFHHHKGGFSFDHGNNSPLVIFPYNRIYFPIPESFPSIDNLRSLVDADTVFNGYFLVDRTFTTLELVSGMLVKCSALSLVLPNDFIDGFMADEGFVFEFSACLLFAVETDPALSVLSQACNFRGFFNALLPQTSHILSIFKRILAFGIGIAFEIPAYHRFVLTDGFGYLFLAATLPVHGRNSVPLFWD